MAELKTQRLRTGEILVEQGVITQAQLDIALQEQRARQGSMASLPIAEILVRNRFCTREQAETAVAQTVEGGVSGLFNTLLPQSICKRFGVLPERMEEGCLIVKAASPLTEAQREVLRQACLLPATSLKVRAVSKGVLEKESAKLFVDTLVLADCLENLRRNEPTGQLIQAAINALMKEALDVRASDILLDYKGDLDSWISWRVDGVLLRKYLVPRRVMGPLVIRIKTEAGMDASETRREQDGRIHHQYAGRIMDFRVSSLPILGGEGLSLRVLDAESLPDLGQMFPYQPDMLTALQSYLRIREKRGGLILLSGQTGSGKTTTLNGMARLLPRERINLVTIENPVELDLPFGRQFQPNEMIGQNMAQIERTLLRQDPDVVVIGEIRDADSACTALKMIESGHLVLTTVHAESPWQALLRVVSIAAERESREWATFVISQFLKLSINQSLWAKPCEVCSVPVPGGVRLNPAGCPHCSNGRRGRVLVHDTVLMGPQAGEIERHELQLALQSGSAKMLSDVQQQPGVRRITRESVVRLMIANKKLAIEDANEFDEAHAVDAAKAAEQEALNA
ncbi:type IV pilus assembly protein PilB [Novimethylophilus kurashikiensis]|uniref:Type IV pilus assembly protein PilB n=1 Tax=Novimethylophilus kurashikiensis TaxID=1825523 RepID=A0A2R5F9W0_9PROT|nr:ATPase, T2SS/T4P/T4SS family [Novimethylophilus kurashikiensis]GBG14609.1 type IV pilus assembly protein PilB [Novimethylophilus kurashikiensis]